MQEWLNQILQSPELTVAVFPAVLVLGVLSAFGSCINIAVYGAITGYSGTFATSQSRRPLIFAGIFFMLGTIVVFTLLGAITGFISQITAAALGSYWKFIVGFLLIFFGLATLNFLPFKLPKFVSKNPTTSNSTIGSAIYGFAIGGAIAACSAACCNPVLPIVLGLVTIKGQTLWGAAILTIYAIGYALPPTAALIGIGLGVEKLSSRLTKVTPIISNIAGVLLIGTGFYMLATA